MMRKNCRKRGLLAVVLACGISSLEPGAQILWTAETILDFMKN